MLIGEIAQLLEGTKFNSVDKEFINYNPTGFSIDSRTLHRGNLFFAICGETFDGHDFVRDALDQGACGVVIAREIPNISESEKNCCLYVPDTLIALQEFARKLLKQWGGPIVGVTGSVGKTTTKELIARVLSTCGRVYASVGNLNNTYGLPLTVLKMISDGAEIRNFEYVVLEMGMSYPGEIARLCQIAPPNVSVVLNVAPVHLENFTNINGIAEAKSEIIQNMVEGGLAVLNLDDPYVFQMAALCKKDKITQSGSQVVLFGKNEAAHVSALNIHNHGLLGSSFDLATLKGNIKVNLPLPGEHFISNALAAAAVGLHFGAKLEDIAQMLGQGVPISHRGEIIQFEEEITVIDDSYNSNPYALKEMILLLAISKATRKILIAGEMLELGSNAQNMHLDCGEFAAEKGINIVIGVSGLAKYILQGAGKNGLKEENLHFVENVENAGELVLNMIQAGDVILVKGSRGVNLDKLIYLLKERFILLTRQKDL